MNPRVPVAQLISAVVIPHRFRSKRQFWSYCDLAVVTKSSADYRVERAQLRRTKKGATTRGLTRNHNRTLKHVFKSAAQAASRCEAFKSWYVDAGDNYSFGGATFTRGAIAAAQAGDRPGGRWWAALAELKAWDGRMTPNSRAAVLAAQMRAAFRRRILNTALGAERARNFGWTNFDILLDRLITERPAEWLPKEFKSYAELLRACYADARQALTQRLGEDESKWTCGN